MLPIAHRIWKYVPLALRNRPFGVYVSTVVFALGVYGVLDGPELPASTSSLVEFFIMVISAYFMIASFFVISALVVNPKKHPTLAVFGEMYGWLFISAAALATAIVYVVMAPGGHQLDEGGTALWIFAWGMLFITSLVRSLDILITHRGHRH